MAGDGAVTAAVHRHFGDELKFDCTIGATHWSAAAQQRGPARPEAGVLLRAGADREAQQGLGAAGPLAAHRGGVDEVLRRQRRLAPRRARQRARGARARLPGDARGPHATRPTATSSRSEEIPDGREAHARRPLRGARRLPVRAALRGGEGGGRHRAARPLRGRGPARRRAGRADARQPVVVVPVPEDHPAPRRARAPRARAGSRGPRPLRQARARRATTRSRATWTG